MKPIHIDLRPSPRLAWLLVAFCLAAVVLVFLLPLPLWARCSSVLGLLCATAWHLGRHVWSPKAITRLEVDRGGKLRCYSRAGDWAGAEVLGSSYVTPQLTVLNLRLPGRRLVQHVVLLPDAVESDAFRRLRVWLLWGTEPGASDQGF